MSKTANRTKVQIVRAAIGLFSIRGFGSTSLREIAEAAKVNSALISYHFKNKQGILESIMIQYFEDLFDILDNQFEQAEEDQDYFHHLMKAVGIVVRYQCENTEVSRIIQRELSVDSMLVREVMSTYIAKLKSCFAQLLEKGMEASQFRKDLEVDMQLIHMMSSMFFPYFNPQIIREVFYLEPMSEDFPKLYVDYLSRVWKLELKIEGFC